MIASRPHVAAMAPYALADLKAVPGTNAISLAQNESAFPPSPKAVAAAREAVSSAPLYPDPDWRELVAAISSVHDIAANGILCGAGSMELIGALVHAYAGPGDDVVASVGAYAFFRTAAQAAGADYRAAPANDLTVDVGALADAVGPRTRLVCVANPGNPTSTRIERDELLRLRDHLPDDVLLLVDEAYGEFADEPGEPVFDLVGGDNTVVCRTFSKAYGLAGMRVGWGLFPPAVAAETRKLLNPNNISAASQAAAAAAMLDQEHMHAVVAETAERRARFTHKLRALGLNVPESSTNFVLIRFADSDDAADADRALRAEGILLRPVAGYGLADCLRATIGTEDAMAFAARTLEAWCDRNGVLR